MVMAALRLAVAEWGGLSKAGLREAEGLFPGVPEVATRAGPPVWAAPRKWQPGCAQTVPNSGAFLITPAHDAVGTLSFHIKQLRALTRTVA